MKSIDERDERVAFFSRIAVPFALAYAILWVLNLDLSHAIPRDGTTLVIGRDFINTWTVGKIAWLPHPEQYYDVWAYQGQIRLATGQDYIGQLWSYPPTMMMVGALPSLLPYTVALTLWTIAGATTFVLALRGWTKDKRLIIAALLCPAAIFGIISGQFAYFAAALILTILRWRQSRPWAAGALLGLLTIKPQLGLFFPILLLAARDWRVIGGAIVSTAAIVGLSILIWGIAPWTAYLGQGIATQSTVLSDPLATVAPFMPTLFMNLRGAGVAVQVASLVQSAAAIFAALLIGWRFFRQPAANDSSANALFLCAAAFGTAYMLSYDTLAMTTAVLLASPPGKTGRWLSIGLFMLTLLQILFGNIGVPGPALLPIAMGLYLAKLAASSMWVDQRN